MRTLARVKESDNNNNNNNHNHNHNNNNNNNFGPVRILMRARAVCTMVTFRSWMVAVRTSTFTVRILGWRESRQVNVTFRWIRNHVPHRLLELGVMCSLPHARRAHPFPPAWCLAWPFFFWCVCWFFWEGALCSGVLFSTTRMAGACLALGPSFGWVLWTLSLSGYREETLRSWDVEVFGMELEVTCLVR